MGTVKKEGAGAGGKLANEMEFENVLSLTAIKRYSYFIKKVVDFEVVWSLYEDDGWAMFLDNDGKHEVLPVWPHARYVEACAKEIWAGYKPREIDINTFLEKWIPGMIDDKRLVAVFPAPDNTCVNVMPERLRDDLESELSLYE
jgi:hypothetical protein